MAEFRTVTPGFSAAAQLQPEDMAPAYGAGFRIIVNNRPDGETPGQPSAEAMRAAAEAAGLDYHALPFTGPPPPAVVAEMARIVAEARAPVLAYCRTGTRSVTAWALATALEGGRAPDEIIALAMKAGYDLANVRDALVHLAPRR